MRADDFQTLSRRRRTIAPKGLKRKTRVGPGGRGNSTASPWTSRMGERSRAEARHSRRFLRAVAMRAGWISTPVTD